jgi:hypothetical protein
MSKIVKAERTNLLKLEKMPKGTRIQAYKVFRIDGKKPRVGYPPVYFGTRVQYKLKKGAVHKQKNCNCSPTEDCGVGLHVCTFPWAQRFWEKFERHNQVMWLVEFTVKDIGVVPYEFSLRWENALGANRNRKIPCSKFRVTRFKLIRQVKWE